MRVFSPTSSKRLNEVTGFVFLGVGMLLLLSLVSYQAQDPSWDTAGPKLRPLNLVGPFGAHIADLVLQSFGAAAFLFPFLAFAAGWKWIRSELIETPIIRLFGFLLFLACFSAGMSLFPNASIFEHLIPVGGIAGMVLADKLRENFNLTGAAVLSATGMIVSIYLFTAFTLDKLDHWFIPVRAFFRYLRMSWKRWREHRRQVALEKKEARRAAREAAAQERAVARQEAAAAKLRVAAEPLVATTAKSKKKAVVVEEVVEGGDAPITSTLDELPWETASERAKNRAATNASGEIPICVLEDQPPVPAAAPMPQFAAPEPPKRTPEPVRNQTVYKLPPTDFLNEPPARTSFDEQELKNTAAAIKAKFEEFNVMGSVVQINPGPVVTTFEFKPDAGVKYSRIIALREDLCLGLQAESILIERIPGKMTVGVEVPNSRREVIALRQILESEEFQNSNSRLTISMGKDINGRIKVANLDTMPHALIAGSTGSGKSVMINSLVMSILYKSTPDEVRMIMVDPKRVELGMYEGIPHLLTPVITDPRKATNALKNAVLEMERRLRLLAEHGARNIEQFNKKVRKLQEQPRNLFDEQDTATEELRPLPFILILIDELADLMMLEGKNVEESVTRLAQMARAVGMHLVLATQRPSVDVITGLIKANFPARISFRVATRVDSRTILDVMGAEHLLGKGDMLFLPPGSSRLTRVHGAFVTETEINGVVDFWKQQASPEYDQSYLIAPPSEDGEPSDVEPDPGEQDPMYEEALRVVLEMGKASTSTLQRRLRLGYGRAARILDMMHRDGIIGPPDGSKPREVLKRPDWLKEAERV